MCRLDRISAHLETFHRLPWICRDQNLRLSAGCEVGELSAAVAPRRGPGATAGSALAGAERAGLCRWRGEGVPASLALCRVVLALSRLLRFISIPDTPKRLQSAPRWPGRLPLRGGAVYTSLLEFPT